MLGVVLVALVAAPVPAAAGVAVDCRAPTPPRAPLASDDAPDLVVPAVVPNDPDLGLLWPYATDAGPTAPARAGDLRAQDAWALATGAGVRVGIVDTGLDPLAADVEPAVLRNPGEVANGLDDDGNGLVDDVRGWDFVTGSPDARDVHPEGHGTQVAGIVAARAGNGLQAAGLAVRQVGARRHVSPATVAAAAGRHLVLRPRGTALDPGDDVLEGQVAVAEREGASAPDAVAAVALEDPGEALRAREARRYRRLGRYPIPSLTHSPSRRPRVRRSTRPSRSIS